MRGLPFDASEKEIYEFFGNYKLGAGCIKIGINAVGQHTGEAAVLFKNPDDAKRAIQEKQGDNIGSRYIELFLITASQFYSFELRYFY